MIDYSASVKRSEIYKIDFDSKKFERIDSYNNSGRIDRSYRIPEDGLFTIIKNNGEEESFEVKKDDIVLRMYSTTEEYLDKEYIVIDNPLLKDYYIRYDTFEQERTGKDKDMVECVNRSEICIKKS